MEDGEGYYNGQDIINTIYDQRIHCMRSALSEKNTRFQALQT